MKNSRFILIAILILLLPVLAFGLNIDTDSNDKVDCTYGGSNVGTCTGTGLCNIRDNEGETGIRRGFPLEVRARRAVVVFDPRSRCP